jgi:hypothetical protein
MVVMVFKMHFLEEQTTTGEEAEADLLIPVETQAVMAEPAAAAEVLRTLEQVEQAARGIIPELLDYQAAEILMQTSLAVLVAQIPEVEQEHQITKDQTLMVLVGQEL